MACFGVDLHSDNFVVCRLDPDCDDPEIHEFQLTSGDISRFLAMLSHADEVAVESTSNSAWFCDRVRASVGRIVVVDPRAFSITGKFGRKTDRNDAHTLARYLSVDLLPSVILKSEIYDDIAMLVHSCDLLVKQQTALSNSLHGLFVRRGVRIEKSKLKTRKYLTGLDTSVLRPAQQQVAGVFAGQILHLAGQIKAMRRRVVDLASPLEGFEGLVSIKGIGEYSAAVFLATIGGVEKFATADKLAAYFGIVPRVYQSSDTATHGRISKAGSRLGRTTLVQCTWVAVRYSNHLKEFFDRIHGNTGSKQKAIVATARKLLRIIYYTLKNGWIFEDFETFKRRGID